MLSKQDYKPELEIEINYRLLYKITHMDLQQKLIDSSEIKSIIPQKKYEHLF